MPALIECRKLTKQFDTRVPQSSLWRLLRRDQARERSADPIVAVDGIDLRIEEGECYGLLGPNGAGKTTTVKMISTLLEQTSGSASVCGFDTVRNGADVRRNIGVMFAGERGLYWRLTGRENLVLFGRMQYMPSDRIRTRIAALGTQLGLAERLDELVEAYSTGMKQRLNLARSLLHDPPVLLLDEPTAALDPAAARATRQLVRSLRIGNRAVLLTTHNMHEAEDICDRVGIIHRGQLVAEDRPHQLIHLAGLEPRLELRLSGDVDSAKEALGGDALWWSDVKQDGGFDVAVRAPDGWRSAQSASERLDMVGVNVIESRLREATLEDAFISLTGSRLDAPLESV